MPKTQIKLPQRIHNSRITKVKLKSDLINGKRCHLCCTKLVENKNKFKNSSKRGFNVSISNSTFGLFLASHILSMNKDLFDNENEENHIFWKTPVLYKDHVLSQIVLNVIRTNDIEEKKRYLH